MTGTGIGIGIGLACSPCFALILRFAYPAGHSVGARDCARERTSRYRYWTDPFQGDHSMEAGVVTPNAPEPNDYQLERSTRCAQQPAWC